MTVVLIDTFVILISLGIIILPAFTIACKPIKCDCTHDKKLCEKCRKDKNVYRDPRMPYIE